MLIYLFILFYFFLYEDRPGSFSFYIFHFCSETRRTGMRIEVESLGRYTKTDRRIITKSGTYLGILSSRMIVIF